MHGDQPYIALRTRCEALAHKLRHGTGLHTESTPARASPIAHSSRVHSCADTNAARKNWQLNLHSSTVRGGAAKSMVSWLGSADLRTSVPGITPRFLTMVNNMRLLTWLLTLGRPNPENTDVIN